MGKNELVLRPGDSLSLKLELPGQVLRLDLALTHDGVVLAPPPARTATRQVMPPPPLAVVAPPPAAWAPEQSVIEVEDDTAATRESAQSVHEEDVDVDVDDLGPEHDTGASPGDFSPHAVTMLPPTRAPEPEAAPIALDDVEFAPQPAPQPNPTLPPWQGGARAYKDPVLEKKKATAARVALAPVKNVPAPSGPSPKPPTARVAAADSWGEAGTGALAGGNTIFAVGPSQPPEAAPGVIPEGDYTVFLTPPKTEDKRQAAAKIIAQIQGISLGDALAQAGKMIVPVAKNVSEGQAQSIRDMFKGAGLSCRITQKR